MAEVKIKRIMVGSGLVGLAGILAALLILPIQCEPPRGVDWEVEGGPVRGEGAMDEACLSRTLSERAQIGGGRDPLHVRVRFLVARRSNGDNVFNDLGSSSPPVDATIRAQELLDAATAATAPGRIFFDLDGVEFMDPSDASAVVRDANSPGFHEGVKFFDRTVKTALPVVVLSLLQGTFGGCIGTSTQTFNGLWWDGRGLFLDGSQGGDEAAVEESFKHEIGHALGLRHTHACQPDGDGIGDTPKDEGPSGAPLGGSCGAAKGTCGPEEVCAAALDDNLMSYYFNRKNFTQQQLGVMRCSLVDRRPNWMCRGFCGSGDDGCGRACPDPPPPPPPPPACDTTSPGKEHCIQKCVADCKSGGRTQALLCLQNCRKICCAKPPLQ